jgi:hypothetical protein
MSLTTVFTTNLKMKLLSLLLAALLWLFVTLEAVAELDIPLAVNAVNIPPGLELKVVAGSAPSLRIAGSRILLLRQKWQGAAVQLDLSAAKEGALVLSEVKDLVKLVQGVTIVRLPLLKLAQHAR